MPDTLRHIDKDAFRTNLDEEIVVLPGRSVRSVVGLFAHMEGLARQKKGEAKARGKSRASRNDTEPESVSFRELGRQVISVARLEVEALHNRMQELQSLVLINDWNVAERLWRDFLPACKTPLFQLNFLEELWGIEPEPLSVELCPLTRFWHQFVLIQAEMDTILKGRRSLVEFSDALERELGTWLKRFSEILDTLDEASTH